ncbi:MAG: hypothetical protein FD180_1789 [Planctomycetota bacterium]|nr:MAG: hypothetical protein FD180_1789 [Planctomycetota bacterium]
MTWLDASIVSVLVLGATFGALTGAFWQIARVSMAVLGALGALRWGSWASGVLENRFSPAVASVFAYFLVFLFLYLAAYAARRREGDGGRSRRARRIVDVPDARILR